jgi:putative transposase
VSARVSPTERIRGDIDELFGSDRPLPEIVEEVARLGAQLLLQAALETEITEYLGRTATSGPPPARMPALVRATATAG